MTIWLRLALSGCLALVCGQTTQTAFAQLQPPDPNKPYGSWQDPANSQQPPQQRPLQAPSEQPDRDPSTGEQSTAATQSNTHPFETHQMTTIEPSAIDSLPPALQKQLLTQNQAPAISHARVSPAALGSTTRLYAVLEGGTKTDKLTAIKTAWATSGEILGQDSTQLTGIALEKDATVDLNQTALSLNLTGLKRALRDGDFFPVTFLFERAGPVRVMVHVQADSP